MSPSGSASESSDSSSESSDSSDPPAPGSSPPSSSNTASTWCSSKGVLPSCCTNCSMRRCCPSRRICSCSARLSASCSLTGGGEEQFLALFWANSRETAAQSAASSNDCFFRRIFANLRFIAKRSALHWRCIAKIWDLQISSSARTISSFSSTSCSSASGCLHARLASS